MARKKKVVEPIVGPGRDPENKLTVQKSLPLFSLWRSDMSLAEFKILDTYLSRINSHEPDKRTVVFTKGELEQLLGVKKINKPDLSARLKGLGRFVELEKENSKKLHQVALFEEAYGEVDENGQWTVKLTCTAKAMKYVFNVEKLGYLRYKLRCITSLTSRYTYVLFMYLESNRFRKSWEVNLEELRQLLNCTEDYYKEFFRFNQKVLQRCQRELHEKTECRFTYEPVKSGRRVVAVRFTLETLSDSMAPAIPGQMSIDDYEDDFDMENDDPNQLIADVLPEGMKPEQVDALRIMAGPKVMWIPGGVPRECLIADYLRKKVMLMKARGKDVKYPFDYLKTMIEKDPDAIYG